MYIKGHSSFILYLHSLFLSDVNAVDKKKNKYSAQRMEWLYYFS